MSVLQKLISLFRPAVTGYLVGLVALLPGVASANCTHDAMLVFDGSGSMASMGFNGLDQPRIVEARRAIREVLPSVAPFRNLGLIIYGPGSVNSCSNIELRLRPKPDAAGEIIEEIDRLSPQGETPLTNAVQHAADVLDFKSKEATVVLVTDGKETCGGETCQLASRLVADAVNITIHVIGFQVRSEKFNWKSVDDTGFENGRTVARCLADISGGKYVSTETAEELIDALSQTLGCSVIGRLDIR